MSANRPPTERISVWIPNSDTLVGTYGLEDRQAEALSVPSFDELFERFDGLWDAALCQHIGRVAKTKGQEVVFSRSYQPYVSEEPETEKPVPAIIDAKAQWKARLVAFKPVVASVYRYSYDQAEQLGALDGMMTEVEQAVAEHRASFTGRSKNHNS